MDEQTTPKKVRRVGSIAFALVLIAAGVLLIVYQFVPQFDLLKILKFSPVILIALGIEMLVYSARPDVKVKFDWLAMLGTAFTLCIVGTAALLPLAISEWGPARNYAQTRIESQKADAMYSALTPNPALKAKTDSLSVDVWFNHDTDGDYTLQSGDDCILDAALRGPYADAEVFAADCMAIMQAAADNNIGFTIYRFSADEDTDDGVSYYLDCVASYPAGLTAAQVAQRVQASYHYDNNSFSSEADRDDYIRRQLQNEISDEYADRHDGAYPDEKYLNEETERRLAERTSMAQPNGLRVTLSPSTSSKGTVSWRAGAFSSQRSKISAARSANSGILPDRRQPRHGVPPKRNAVRQCPAVRAGRGPAGPGWLHRHQVRHGENRRKAGGSGPAGARQPHSRPASRSPASRYCRSKSNGTPSRCRASDSRPAAAGSGGRFQGLYSPMMPMRPVAVGI